MHLQKSICIPGTPPVEIAPFLPIVEHPHFQRLRERKQLGVNYLIFPGAVHTRFEHTVGVLATAQRLCRIQQLSQQDARNLQVFALLHDIGHGPYSHQIEPVLRGNHHDRGLLRIDDLSDAIQRCGADPQTIRDMLLETNPLGAWISDRNLGADKLDYLMRDALHIGFFGIPDIEKIQFQTIMTADGLAISQKFIEDAKQLQRFYSYLHQHGYLNKTALAAQRMLQRAVQQELLARDSHGDELWDMTDHQLRNWLSDVQDPVAQRLSQALENRILFRSAISLKPVGYAYVEHDAGKPMAVREWPRALLKRFADIVQNPETLMKLEDRLADECGLPHGELLFASMPFFRKLIPKDLRVFTEDNGSGFWLFEHDRDHCKALVSDYLRTFAIRILVPEDFRSRAVQLADRLEGQLQELILSNAALDV